MIAKKPSFIGCGFSSMSYGRYDIILNAQESQENFHPEKFLDRAGIMPITVSMLLLNSRALTAWVILAPMHMINYGDYHLPRRIPISHHHTAYDQHEFISPFDSGS